MCTLQVASLARDHGESVPGFLEAYKREDSTQRAPLAYRSRERARAHIRPCCAVTLTRKYILKIQREIKCSDSNYETKICDESFTF